MVRRARSVFRLAALGMAVLSAAACERTKSANPLSPDVAGPLPGVNITAPKPLEPVAGTIVDSTKQPLSLLIENAGTSGPRPLWLEVDLASDQGFNQIVHEADRLTPGEGGRTTYRLPEPLGAGHTYYWRVRAADGANTGPFSAVSHFTVQDPVVIETPVPLEPSGTLSTTRPQFKVRNGRISGPAGTVVYRFEIADRPDPSATLAVITVSPGTDGTTTMSLGSLPHGETYWWRAYATNGEIDSPRSGALSFQTPAAPAPTPGPGPGPGPIPSPAPGGRTPDPPPGQRLPLPNMFHVVQQVAAQYPHLLRNSCQDHGGSWAFMDLLVDTLRSHDTRWGYNWKRGRVGDASHDVVDYHWGAGPDEGSTEVYIIDVITGHCGSNPAPGWGDVTDITYRGGSIGRWTGRGRF